MPIIKLNTATENNMIENCNETITLLQHRIEALEQINKQYKEYLSILVARLNTAERNSNIFIEYHNALHALPWYKKLFKFQREQVYVKVALTLVHQYNDMLKEETSGTAKFLFDEYLND